VITEQTWDVVAHEQGEIGWSFHHPQRLPSAMKPIPDLTLTDLRVSDLARSEGAAPS
jgi:hypothetical protein